MHEEKQLPLPVDLLLHPERKEVQPLVVANRQVGLVVVMAMTT
jgi:hypothetical protein